MNSPSPLASGRFVGRQAFSQRFHAALAEAANQGWNHLILCDADFADWPLGDRATQDALNAWSNSQRQLTLYARSYQHLTSHHHRFVAWRKQWQHIVQAWVCPSIGAEEFPSVLMGPRWLMHRIDPERAVGVCDDSPARLVALREMLGEVQAKSSPGFPASVLGL